MKARGRLSDESGFTLTEMLVVLVILGIVLAALTQLFVSATRTEVDQDKRFQAQQEARLALDSLRREIHCASAVTSTQTEPASRRTVDHDHASARTARAHRPAAATSPGARSRQHGAATGSGARAGAAACDLAPAASRRPTT